MQMSVMALLASQCRISFIFYILMPRMLTWPCLPDSSAKIYIITELILNYQTLPLAYMKILIICG